jgi:DNA-binding NarL/FixJ family response regulator
MKMPTMVVDDQPDVRFLIRLLIDKANDGLVVVAEASNGAEALDRAAEAEPLVVVMDEMMPGMNGIEAAGQLKRSNPSQVIILCTAYLDDELVARAREAGILHCISKEQVGDLPDLIRRAVASA